ncbi:RHS repeat-associated core domain-containing protein [Streptomyces cavourensis]
MRLEEAHWLGAKQRSTETLTGLTLMGVRLYNPNSGRFLSLDPVYGGNANAYDYVHGDPLNRFDLDGKFSWKKKWKTFRTKSWKKWTRRGIRIGAAVGAAVGTGAICAMTAGAGCIVAGFVLGTAAGSIDYQARFLFQRKKRMNRNDHVKNIGLYAIPGVAGASVGKLKYLSKFFRGSGKRRK